jgi:hypothetical protein
MKIEITLHKSRSEIWGTIGEFRANLDAGGQMLEGKLKPKFLNIDVEKANTAHVKPLGLLNTGVVSIIGHCNS